MHRRSPTFKGLELDLPLASEGHQLFCILEKLIRVLAGISINNHLQFRTAIPLPYYDVSVSGLPKTVSVYHPR